MGASWHIPPLPLRSSSDGLPILPRRIEKSQPRVTESPTLHPGKSPPGADQGMVSMPGNHRLERTQPLPSGVSPKVGGSQHGA